MWWFPLKQKSMIRDLLSIIYIDGSGSRHLIVDQMFSGVMENEAGDAVACTLRNWHVAIREIST